MALFGIKKAFLPMTWNGALSREEDRIALYCRIAEVLTKQMTMAKPSRTLVLYDPSRQDPTLYPRESMVRAMWYMVHAALDSSSAANIMMLCSFRMPAAMKSGVARHYRTNRDKFFCNTNRTTFRYSTCPIAIVFRTSCSRIPVAT